MRNNISAVLIVGLFFLFQMFSTEAFAQSELGVQKNHPYLLVTDEIISEAVNKKDRCEWALEAYDEIIKRADNFKVPVLKHVTKGRPVKVWTSLNYTVATAEEAFITAVAWKMTGNLLYLNKIKSFLADLCNPELGYPAVKAATTGVEVHEGGFFFYLSALCDILYDRAMTDSERSAIDNVMRIYLAQVKGNMRPDGIMNHQASANAGAVMVSLYLWDEELFNHFVNSPGGMIDHIAKGVMDDGWWFEGTANYAYLVADIYFRLAQVFENTGLDLYHREIPARDFLPDFHNCPRDYAGMQFTVWGPKNKKFRTLYDMSMAYHPLMDQNGIIVSSNDTNHKEPAEFFELAYRAYHDEALAWVLTKSRRNSWIPLLYGVEELPEKISDPRNKSIHLDNVGITALRSDCEDSANQIQAFLKFGTHGGWHGHFDRVSLLGLDRYGHHYFGTEMCWFGYGAPGYKECVQTSATHNMVIVDEMQQEAVPSKQEVFYDGKRIKCSSVRTNARWRPVPTQNKTLSPIWEDFPYVTTAILQRRVAVLTNDYLLLTDYLQSERFRTFDCIFHPLGLESYDGLVYEKDAVWSKMPFSPFTYFRDCKWYNISESGTPFFKFNDDGFGLNVYSLCPQDAKVMIGGYPVGGRKQEMRNDDRRNSIAFRKTGKEAVFVNLLEPYKGESVVKYVKAFDDEHYEVHLKDGRVHKFSLSGFKSSEGDSIKVSFEEIRDGKIVYSECNNK